MKIGDEVLIRNGYVKWYTQKYPNHYCGIRDGDVAIVLHIYEGDPRLIHVKAKRCGVESGIPVRFLDIAAASSESDGAE